MFAHKCRGRFYKLKETGRECIWAYGAFKWWCYTEPLSDQTNVYDLNTGLVLNSDPDYFKFASAWISGEIRIPVGANTFRFNNRVYWFSWSDPANAQKSWSEAEKQCRTQCMELVSLDSPGETEFVAAMIPRGKFREF